MGVVKCNWNRSKQREQRWEWMEKSLLAAARRSLLHSSARLCPTGTPENSPAIYRWVSAPANPPSPGRGERIRWLAQPYSAVPDGTRLVATPNATDESVGYFLSP